MAFAFNSYYHSFDSIYQRTLRLIFSCPQPVKAINTRDNIFMDVSVHVLSAGSCHHVLSSKSFLFSLYSINGYAPVKLDIKSSPYSTAIYTCSSYGPTCGGANDLHTVNNAASNRNSFAYCGHTYPLPPGYSASGLVL